jgi:selenocysteine-specific elongation factor
MTVVIGTAGHIDHGKTTLLRALTGIDADRLPEERRRGMTIDVGYAHLALDDGTELDFVDVPGHDKLVGNMLVGAGEIDAALLVVAADDGPRAQTLEHLALLDALGIRIGVAAVTKADIAGSERVAAVVEDVRRLLVNTTLAGAPVLAVSGISGDGLDALRVALVGVRDAVLAEPSGGGDRPPTLAVDRVFSVKGRGVVVTGTLRGDRLDRGASLRSVPGDLIVRVREVQVHGVAVDSAGPGRTALNLAGVDGPTMHRGLVLTADPSIAASSRLLVRLRTALPDRMRARLHLGTAAVDASVGRSGRDAVDLPDGTAIAILRLAEPIATAPGDRFVLRRSGGADSVVGGAVLDVHPPRGVSRRRQTVERLAGLADAVEARDAGAITAARIELHGAGMAGDAVTLAPDVAESARTAALASVMDQPAGDASLIAVRAAVGRAIRHAATARRDVAQAAAVATIDELVRAGRLVRDGDRLRPLGTAPVAPDPAMAAAMDRLEEALAVPAPPSLVVAARSAACPPAGIRELERTGRIVVLEPDLAYAASTYRELTAQALALADRGPLTPAAYRDATGTSRKYVMAILEDLDRRGILRRTDAGHLPGPRAAQAPAGRGPARPA